MKIGFGFYQSCRNRGGGEWAGGLDRVQSGGVGLCLCEL